MRESAIISTKQLHALAGVTVTGSAVCLDYWVRADEIKQILVNLILSLVIC
jgi:hypothetical protein